MRQRPTNAGESGVAGVPDQYAAFIHGVTMWSIDGVSVPCIIRDGKPHGPVRVLEKELLNSLASTAAVNAAFQNRGLLVSKYLTESEAFRLTYFAGRKFGMFTTKDLVVDIQDFRQLLAYLKSTVYNSTTAVTGGWLQLNNSVIPYLRVGERKLLPLPVVMNAAGLLCDVSPRLLPLHHPTDDQCRYLNDLCADAGLDFTFRTSTELVDMAVVCARTKPTPYARELHGKDPFVHAHFIDDSLLATPTSAAAAFQPWHTAPVDVLTSAASHPPNGLSSLLATSEVVPQAVGPAVTSSHQSARPTQALTVIEPVSFRGRTISSLRRPADNNRYILLDAVCRVFFPEQRNVDGFIRAVETLFHIPDVRMTEAEQQHFISFYKLPTDRLTYCKLIRHDLLTDIFPNLERMFSAELDVVGGQLIGTIIPRSPSDSATTSHGHTAQTPATATSTCTTTTSNSNNNNKNNNNNSDDVTSRRKRRRKDICTEVVVID